MSKVSTYQDRLQSLTAKSDVLTAKDKKLSIFRFLFFVTLIALIIISFQWNVIAAMALTYIGIYSFYRLILHHNQVRYTLDLHATLIKLNEAELAALNNDHSAFANGENYIDHTHAYTTDLDIFGDKSLFQKTCRCGSQKGRDTLAQHFLKTIPYDEISSYQEANKELENEINFRQKLYASGALATDDSKHLSDLHSWIQDKERIGVSPFLLLGIPLLCLAIFAAILYYNPLGELNMFTGLLYFVVAYAPSIYLNKRNKPKIDNTHNFLTKTSKHLLVYSRLISLVEVQSFKSHKLQELQSIFLGENVVSNRIKKLAYYCTQLDIRYNFFGIFFNILFLWDHIYVYLIQRWKDTNANELLQWFDNLGKIEAISSTATLAYNHPTWAYPQLSGIENYTGINLGHPLLPDTARVCNDFDMPTRSSIKIITGSNMGGKSTFLRTIGINTVLAYMGTTTCSSLLQIPDLKIFTSMRTVDDLSENTSSFYAELKRLKVVLDAVIRGENVFFLLDEILKGTNSNDRHNGAKALIMQLLRHKGAGLISTHDLELGNLVTDHGDRIENKCFEVETKDGKLVFDYLLKDGVSKSFNATELMRSMGIDI